MSDIINILSKGLLIRAPHDQDRTANDFGPLRFTVPTKTAGHAANAIPDDWRNARYVIVQHTNGGAFDFAFSESATAEVDAGVTALAAGASTKVGYRCRIDQDVHVILPEWPSGNTMYFVREGIDDTASTECSVILADVDPMSLAIIGAAAR